MFIGRQKEINVLRSVLERKSASVLVYGKRKVGKTTLIGQALKGADGVTVYYECLRASLKDNIDGLTGVLAEKNVFPVKINFESFQDLFAYLNSTDKTYNIVIDEYPYLKQFTKSETVDSIFQSIIDNRLGNIRLFLSGSHVGMMCDLLSEKNALYGRFGTVLKLTELDYLEASEFYPQKSVYDKVAFYSVFGGSPFVNGALDPKKSLKENIIDTILNPVSAVNNYAEHILISDFSIGINAERILYAISNGRKKYGAIEEKLGMQSNGLLSKQLKILLDMDIVTKVNPINRPTDKKKTSYEISDNVMRFYYAYIYANKSALQTLGANAFYDTHVAPTLTTYIAHRFEDICRTYFVLAVRRGTRTDIYNIGTLYYDDSATKTNGEFDVAIQKQTGFDVYEVKYQKKPLSVKDMELEEELLRKIPGLSVGTVGFISISGFDAAPAKYDLITGEMLYDI